MSAQIVRIFIMYMRQLLYISVALCIYTCTQEEANISQQNCSELQTYAHQSTNGMGSSCLREELLPSTWLSGQGPTDVSSLNQLPSLRLCETGAGASLSSGAWVMGASADSPRGRGFHGPGKEGGGAVGGGGPAQRRVSRMADGHHPGGGGGCK